MQIKFRPSVTIVSCLRAERCAQLDNRDLVLEIYTKDYEKEEYIFNNEKATRVNIPMVDK